MKVLRIGDPHAKIGNLAEMARLMIFVSEVAIEKDVDRIEILGDLFHNHAILRVEVLDFWVHFLESLSEIKETFIIEGNHDQPGDFNVNTSSLRIFNKLNNKNLVIVDSPIVDGIFGYMPYYHDANKFIEESNSLALKGAKILVCHQTFSGSKYDNGMYAPDGIESDKLNFNLIISGHIHKYQKFGNVIYPGTPKWDSISDANEKKGIWIFEHDDINGEIKSQEFLSTENVCTPILSFVYKETDSGPPDWPENAKVNIELVGTSNWISSTKEKFKGKCSITCKITDKKKNIVRKTGKSFEDFLNTVYTSLVDKKELISYAKELGLV
jgi:DNA repair exonuclease SbcCD nuclease subunit